ncbi:hypothetical protein ACJIZ3_001477 [Penstemon smallii]|uniref:Uncharacterized protein n=1 Tax=Penstemon smallii TaxID=265156 RepID=A0ABD3U3P0_9LAMI
MMKRASVSFNQSDVTVDDAKTKLRYQTFLKEFLELQKENVSRKRKLQAAKLKRETILAEVRFLRRRHNFLSKSSARNLGKDHLHNPNSDILESINALEQERNSDQVPKDEEEKQVFEEDAKNPMNFLIRNKGGGGGGGGGESKRKISISWPDDRVGVTLKVRSN